MLLYTIILGAQMTPHGEEGITTTIHDLHFYLTASQDHINPTHPEVAKLISQELQLATKLIENNSLGLHMVVGSEPIEAVEPNVDDPGSSKDVTVQPSTELIFEGTEAGSVIATLEDRPLRIDPSAIARSLMQGGKLFTPQREQEEGEDGFYGEPEAEIVAPPKPKRTPAPKPNKPPLTQTAPKPKPVPEPEAEPDLQEPEYGTAAELPVVDHNEIEVQSPTTKKNVEPADLESRRKKLTERIMAKGRVTAQPDHSFYANGSQATWFNQSSAKSCSIYLPKNEGGIFTIPLKFNDDARPSEEDDSDLKKPIVPNTARRALWGITFHEAPPLGLQAYFMDEQTGRIGRAALDTEEENTYHFPDEQGLISLVEQHLDEVFRGTKVHASYS